MSAYHYYYCMLCECFDQNRTRTFTLPLMESIFRFDSHFSRRFCSFRFVRPDLIFIVAHFVSFSSTVSCEFDRLTACVNVYFRMAYVRHSYTYACIVHRQASRYMQTDRETERERERKTPSQRRKTNEAKMFGSYLLQSRKFTRMNREEDEKEKNNRRRRGE